MGVFSLITLAALVSVAGATVRLDRTGTHALRVAALSAGAAGAQGDAVLARPLLTDRSAGLSYSLLSDPWHDGCARTPAAAQFSWTGGESALAGRLPGGSDWYANACSAPLPRQFAGQGQAQAAWKVADAIQRMNYGALSHSTAVMRSAAVKVAGRPGWLAEFRLRYSGAAHLAWSSELAAVVVTGHSVFYVSVPANLGTGTVAALLGSLQ